MRWWVKPWMIWVVGFPCALIDRQRQAFAWAFQDVQEFVAHMRREKERRDNAKTVSTPPANHRQP